MTLNFNSMFVNNYDVGVNNSSDTSVVIFENPLFGNVRFFGDVENPYFCLPDLCRILGLNTSQVIKRLDDGVVCIHPIEDNLGRVQDTSFVNEDGFYDVVMDSRKPIARKLRKWVTSEVLPSLRRTGSYSIREKPKVAESVGLEEQVRAVGAAAEIFQKLLRASDASVAAYLNKGIVPLGLPPIDYVPSKGSKFSATDLLKKFNRTESIYRFNDRMVELGYLEEKTRPSTKTPNKVKKFKELTEAGLEFGENMVSPKNERETQPHYYEHKFGELLSILFG